MTVVCLRERFLC